jgi:NADPH:quinone reductase-like Zn-dependent oxidoreductase
MAEESSIRHAGARGYLGGCGLLVPALAPQLQRRALKAAARVLTTSRQLAPPFLIVINCLYVVASVYDVSTEPSSRIASVEVKMKRIQYSRYGGPQELELRDIELPNPGRDQIRVRVVAASVNPMDWKIREGQVKVMTGSTFPRGLGHDFAGVVDALGPDVTKFKVGDEVLGATGLKEAGTFAEAVIAEVKNTMLKPAGLPFEVAGSLPIVAITAWTGLFDKAKLRPGQSVFITGCLGGVGRAAVQLARQRGATVAGSCSAIGRDEALALGVGEVVDYRAFDVAPLKRRFDVVFDTAGALSLSQCDAILKRGGMALHIVVTPAKALRGFVSSRHKIVFGTPTPEGMAGIAKAALSGELAPKISRTVSLSEAIPALVALETTGSPKGKLVIAPTGRPE